LLSSAAVQVRATLYNTTDSGDSEDLYAGDRASVDLCRAHPWGDLTTPPREGMDLRDGDLL
jgi:hypothetical protein